MSLHEDKPEPPHEDKYEPPHVPSALLVNPMKQYEQILDKQYELIQQLHEHAQQRKEYEKDKEVLIQQLQEHTEQRKEDKKVQ